MTQEEISELNDIVNMYLNYAENQAKRHIPQSMEDWVTKLDMFLQFNEYDILKNPGKISREIANKMAGNEFKKFKKIQDANYISDFDKSTKKYLGNKDNT